jgi:hypothetical protein
MTLQPQPEFSSPEETARVARAAYLNRHRGPARTVFRREVAYLPPVGGNARLEEPLASLILTSTHSYTAGNHRWIYEWMSAAKPLTTDEPQCYNFD